MKWMVLDPEELGTWDGALRYTMILARRWQLLEIPEGVVVEVTGLQMQGEKVVTPGVAILHPKKGEGPDFYLSASEFAGTNVIDAAEMVVEIAMTEIERLERLRHE